MHTINYDHNNATPYELDGSTTLHQGGGQAGAENTGSGGGGGIMQYGGGNGASGVVILKSNRKATSHTATIAYQLSKYEFIYKFFKPDDDSSMTIQW